MNTAAFRSSQCCIAEPSVRPKELMVSLTVAATFPSFASASVILLPIIPTGDGSQCIAVLTPPPSAFYTRTISDSTTPAATSDIATHAATTTSDSSTHEQLATVLDLIVFEMSWSTNDTASPTSTLPYQYQHPAISKDNHIAERGLHPSVCVGVGRMSVARLNAIA
ncbi:hypothetical protein PoB_002856500 [Plakobranchus ocellatus]|uniref:Uncharacterized protein n=1 Tax=Plakobranchus ocellatus TaxID=259542 RepID=A0AAV4A3T4_9GAST|nr:hypothetical protein PoB_002856500 [Plakobranchus ocellatus]